MVIGLFHYVFLSMVLFLIGIFGILLNRKNLISLIMSVEIIFLSININFISFSNVLNDFKGQFFVLLVLVVSASEIAVVLTALVIYFKNHNNTINTDDLSELRGIEK